MSGQTTYPEYMTIDGVSTADFGVWLFGNGVETFPTRDVETIEVPGRSGTLTVDRGRFKNVEIPYGCVIPNESRANLAGLRAFLLSYADYRRIEDTFRPEEYRMGRYVGGTEPKIVPPYEVSTFTLTFDCKPQRWLKEGEMPLTYTSSGRIYNPTPYPACPLLRIYGAGQVGIGRYTITISQADTYTDIDCDIMEAYKDSAAYSRNRYVTFSTTGSISFAPGDNGVSLGSGITKAVVTPRWYTI